MLLLLLLLLMVTCIAGYCPVGCGCDDTLLSVTCLKTDMEVMPISLNPSILSLVLRLNKFSTVDASISFYPRLKNLDLARNRIKLLPEKIFLSQQNLVNLQLARNDISRMTPLSFSGLKQLKVLNMSGNPLNSLSNSIFRELPTLEDLDLSFANLSTLENGTFIGLHALSSLRLSHNNLHEISGSWFVGLDKLKDLDLSWNSLQSINQQLPLPGLIRLDLSTNLLNSLSAAWLTELKTLEYFNLEENKLEYVPTSGLESLERLRELVLSSNPFSSVPAFSFPSNPDLRRVDISGCPNLRKVQSLAFGANRRLESVRISQNFGLEELEPTVFSPELETLEHLDISDNLLRQLQPNMAPWGSLLSVQISGNPWNCDCSALVIRSLIEDQILKGGAPVRRTICFSPEEYRNTDILALPDSVCLDSKTERQTEDHRANLILYMSTLVFTTLIIIIVVIIIAVFCFLCIRRLCRENRFRSASSTGTDETYCQVRESSTVESPSSKKSLDCLDPDRNQLARLPEPEFPGGIMYFYRDPQPAARPGGTRTARPGRPDYRYCDPNDFSTQHARTKLLQHRTLRHDAPHFEDCEQEFRPLTLSYIRR